MSDEPTEADGHEGRLARLAHRLADADPRPELPRGVRLAMTIGPFVGFGLILLVAYLAYGRAAASLLFLAEIGSFVGAGKFVIFGGVLKDIFGGALKDAPVSVWALAGLIIYGDLGTALVMMANMTLLYRMPFVGARLAACHQAGWYVLRVHRWMRRTAWLGVAAFVAAPFQGSGAVVGTVLARALGLSRIATLTAMVFGSATGCLALAILGDYGRGRVHELGRHPLVAIALLAATVALLVVVGRWFTGESLRGAEEEAGKGEAA